MITGALLSAIHLLTLALGLGAVYARGRALAGRLDDAGWRRLLAADNAWGIAAHPFDCRKQERIERHSIRK